MLFKYNDNELLYLISENDEIAFESLCEKYSPLIKNRLKRFKINRKNFDDFYQECLMVLYKCAINYRDDKSHTFNKYLDVSIQNRIKNLLRDEFKYFYGVTLLEIDKIDCLNNYNTNSILKEDSYILFNQKKFNQFENDVINKYKNGNNIKEIARLENKSYYIIYRIINKYQDCGVNSNVRLIDDCLLSNLEKTIYKANCNGYKPKEIAQIYGFDINIVYNALKRIKKKIINNQGKI